MNHPERCVRVLSFQFFNVISQLKSIFENRLEGVRHCRWVDEVVEDAPWVIDAAFIEKHQIDYVAHDEEAYQSAGYEDVYGFAKSLGMSPSPNQPSRITDYLLLGPSLALYGTPGKFLPTRRTPGISTSDLIERMVRGYRNRIFDPKLAKMGREDLKAEGSDYDDMSRLNSRAGSRTQSRRGSIGGGSSHLNLPSIALLKAEGGAET
jgi:choline-phosphate cytidylyltransferase